MENEPYHHRQNSFYLPPTPSRNGGSMRHRSLSPSVLKATRDADGRMRTSSPRRRSFGPRSVIPNSPSHVSLRASPLASRTLSELNTSSRDEDITLSPVHLQYLKPRPLQLPPPETPPADVTSTSICTSACSTPSSPFMELVYSASATTAETPDIFRQLDEEDKETPVMANPRHTRTSSDAASMQSMIHETNSPSPRHSIPATWVVPRILNTNLVAAAESVTTNNEKSATSPFSLPSMLGATNNSYDSEEVSELESPMLFSSTTEASDIQSRSEATDIYSLRTTPTHTLEATAGSSANAGENLDWPPLSNVPPISNHESAPQSSATGLRSPPGPLVRCDAHDELDDRIDDDGADESDSAATPNLAAITPSLSQLASSSGFLLSRQEVVEAAYESDSQEILCEDPYIRRLQQQHARLVQEQTDLKKQKQRWMVQSKMFFQSPQTVQFRDMDGDDGMISELSSHQGDARDIEQGGKSTHVDPGAILPATITASSSASESSASNPRYFYARSRLGLVCRLVTIVLLALCILAPLVGVFIHSRRQKNMSPVSINSSTNNNGDNENIGLTMFPKPSYRPTRAPQTPGMGAPVPSIPNPTTVMPTLVDAAASQTSAPTATATFAPTTGAPTFSPTSTPNLELETQTPTEILATPTPTPTNAPSKAILPSLPPVHAIWDEATWISQQQISSSGPLWATRGAALLQLTILNSLTNPSHSIILEETIQDWAESSVIFDVISDPPANPLMSVGECIPALGKIRVCNGNFGDTASRFFSNVYVNDEQQIIAATVLQNDQFGIDGSDLLGVTSESLAYNYCHELGHTFGLFHNLQGCMVEHISLDALAEDLFVRPDTSDLETLDAMYGL